MVSGVDHVDGDFPVDFRYTAGIAGERFFREIMENGKLVASRCEKCSLSYIPPRIFCERCLSKLDQYVDVENVGTVDSFTLCARDSDGSQLAEPVGVCFVTFPSYHGGLIHFSKGKLTIGDKVKATFKEKGKRTGSILDIKYFEKV